jgi:hypothetical protein
LIRRLVAFLLLGVLATEGWAEIRLFIVDTGKPEGAPELVAVESERNEGSKVVLQQSNGTKREVSKESILARLPAAPGPGEVLTREAAAKAISDLLEAKTKVPVLEKVLQEEVEKWKACLDKLPSAEDPGALAKAEAAFAEAFTRAMPKAHYTKNDYSMEEIRQQIKALEALKKEFPNREPEIDRGMEPWRMEETERLVGKKKFEGRWLTPEEWEKEKGAREKAAREGFLKKIQLPEVSSVLIGQGILLAGVAMAAGALLLGVSFLFHGAMEIFKHRAWWKGAAWLVAGGLMMGLLGVAAELGLSFPEPLDITGNGNPAPLEEFLWQQVGNHQPFPQEIHVSDVDLNAWWQKRLRFAPLAVTELLVVSTDGWRVQFLEGGLKLDREGRILGRRLLLRHELTLSRAENGEEIYRVEATLGKLPLPPALVLSTWEAWMQDLARVGGIFPGGNKERVGRLEKGAVVLTQKAKTQGG